MSLIEKLIKSLNKEENYLSNLIYKTENNIYIKYSKSWKYGASSFFDQYT